MTGNRAVWLLYTMFDPYTMGQQCEMKFYAEIEHLSSSQQLKINKMAFLSTFLGVKTCYCINSIYFGHQEASSIISQQKMRKKNFAPGLLEVHLHFGPQIQSRTLYRWATGEMGKIAKIDVYLTFDIGFTNQSDVIFMSFSV